MCYKESLHRYIYVSQFSLTRVSLYPTLPLKGDICHFSKNPSHLNSKYIFSLKQSHDGSLRFEEWRMGTSIIIMFWNSGLFIAFLHHRGMITLLRCLLMDGLPLLLLILGKYRCFKVTLDEKQNHILMWLFTAIYLISYRDQKDLACPWEIFFLRIVDFFSYSIFLREFWR